MAIDTHWRYRAARDAVRPRCAPPAFDPVSLLDYRERGAYFVTVCTSDRALLFEDAGLRAIAEDVWRGVAMGSDRMQDEFVVMPNHVHGIIWLPGTTALRGLDLVRRVESGSLAAIVRTFKAATAKRINNIRGTRGAPVWQRNYYERVIRDDRELEHAREYILDNPRRWAEDKYNRASAGERPA